MRDRGRGMHPRTTATGLTGPAPGTKGRPALLRCPWAIVPSQPILRYIFSMLWLGPPDTDQQFISSNPKSVYSHRTGQGHLPNLGRSFGWRPIFFFPVERINLPATRITTESSRKQPCCRHPDIDVELVVNPFDKYIPRAPIRLPNA